MRWLVARSYGGEGSIGIDFLDFSEIKNNAARRSFRLMRRFVCIIFGAGGATRGVMIFNALFLGGDIYSGCSFTSDSLSKQVLDSICQRTVAILALKKRASLYPKS